VLISKENMQANTWQQIPKSQLELVTVKLRATTRLSLLFSGLYSQTRLQSCLTALHASVAVKSAQRLSPSFGIACVLPSFILAFIVSDPACAVLGSLIRKALPILLFYSHVSGE